MASSQQDMFAGMIKGKSDEEILQLLSMLGGPEPALDTFFGGMVSQLNPDRAVDCVLDFRLSTPDKTHDYVIVIKDKKATLEKGARDDATTTFVASLADYLRVLAGDLDPMSAMGSGRLQLLGDMMMAMQLTTMFQPS